LEYTTSDIRENRGMIKKFFSSLYHLAGRISPIDYVRWREFSFVLGAVEKYLPSPGKILDISSPKLLPLTLAESLPNSFVCSTDILESEIVYVQSAKKQLHLNNLLCERMDARWLGFSDNSFSLITSISVLEHIAPEKEGEVPAVKEIHRVLSSNGIAIITVPFSKSYFVESKKGTVYERKINNGENQFFQRFYDLNTLMKNIVKASSLELVYLGFIEERLFIKDPHKRLTHYISGTWLRTLLFGPLYPILSRIFLSKPKELNKCKKPYLACLVMKKP
jgi:predicted SAM-dependent methyltransferase